MEIRSTSTAALSKLISRTAKSVFNHKINVSNYDFRHAVASDAKAAGEEEVDIANFLSHCNTKTQKVYGQDQQSRAKKSPFVTAKGSRSVRTFERAFGYSSKVKNDTKPLKPT